MENFSDSTGIRGAVESRIGGRSENQDSYGMSETRLGMLVVVCDGMGGGPAGKTASSIAVQAIIDYVSGASVDRNPVSVLEDAGIAANEAVMAAVADNPELKGMGTTCVCVLVRKAKAYVMHIGDSRCYQLRAGKAVFRTADHSYVGELVRRGTMTEEDARNSRYSNVITRAIGSGPEVVPEVSEVRCRPGDRFVLMTDGIWGAMPEPQLVVLLCSDEEPAGLTVDIAGRVDRIGHENGGSHDNLTLGVVDLPGGAGRTAVILNDRFAGTTADVAGPTAVKTGHTGSHSWTIWVLSVMLLAAVGIISFLLIRDGSGAEKKAYAGIAEVTCGVDPDSRNDSRRKQTENANAGREGQDRRTESARNDASSADVPDNVGTVMAGLEKGDARAGDDDHKDSDQYLVQAIVRLQTLRDYNRKERSRDDRKVRQGRVDILNEAGGLLKRSAVNSHDSDRRAAIESIGKDMVSGESRRRMLNMYNCESSREALDEIDRYIARISAIMQKKETTK